MRNLLHGNKTSTERVEGQFSNPSTNGGVWKSTNGDGSFSTSERDVENARRAEAAALNRDTDSQVPVVEHEVE